MRHLCAGALGLVLFAGCRAGAGVSPGAVASPATQIEQRLTTTSPAVVVDPDRARAAVAAPSPAPTLNCRAARLQFLMDEFFAAYNRADLAALEPLFASTSTTFQYYDDVNGNVADLRDADALRQYFERRFALGDRFVVTEIQIGDRADRVQVNPIAAFTRTSTEGAYTGNVKLVCQAGKIIGLVTTSIPAS